MKRVLSLALSLLLLIIFTSCKKQEIVNEEVEVLGGYKEASNQEITPKLLEIFDKATKDYVGVGFSPIKLLATQVVAGTNYKFLCDATSVSLNPKTYQAIVTIYVDLDGNAKITVLKNVNKNRFL